MKNYLLTVIVFFGINSCTKDKVDNSCHSPSLISQVKSGEVFVNDLIYNNNCQIAEAVEPSMYKKYLYDSQNRLIKMERSLSFNASFSCVAFPNSTIDSGADPRQAKVTDYYDFEYDNTGKLTKRLSFFLNSGNAQLLFYQIYTYVNGNVVKCSMYSPQDMLTQYDNYEYDVSGNLIKTSNYRVELNGNIILLHTVYYEYDDKINPFTIFNNTGEPGRFTNQNNITKETYVWYSEGKEYKNESTTVYEYNKSGFPVKSNGLQYLYGE